MTLNHILTTGDIVKLKQPYRPEEWICLKPDNWKGFEFGIVVEIVSSQFCGNSGLGLHPRGGGFQEGVNDERYGSKQQPRNISLHLYDSAGQLMIYPQYIEAGLLVPAYVDFHISELILYRIASQNGYETVAEPPDWDRVWDDEVSVLKEFGVDL